MLHSRENTLHLTQLSMAAIEQLSHRLKNCLVPNMQMVSIDYDVILWLVLITAKSST